MWTEWAHTQPTTMKPPLPPTTREQADLARPDLEHRAPASSAATTADPPTADTHAADSTTVGKAANPTAPGVFSCEIPVAAPTRRRERVPPLPAPSRLCPPKATGDGERREESRGLLAGTESSPPVAPGGGATRGLSKAFSRLSLPAENVGCALAGGIHTEAGSYDPVKIEATDEIHRPIASHAIYPRELSVQKILGGCCK